MIYLSGAVNAAIGQLMRPDLGVMIQPGMGNSPFPTLPWAYDNGAFSGKFDHQRWLNKLTRLEPYQSDCLFVVAPDVVGDAAATWERSKPYLPLIRSLGYPAALAAQDGMSDPYWELFDCLFVGGTDNFKLSESTYELVREAKRRRKWTHMGRVNGWDRIKAASIGGYDSADGTKIAFGPAVNLPYVLRWLDTLNTQMVMPV